MKQYFLVEAYSNNFEVYHVKDGKIEFYELIPRDELERYELHMQKAGYEKAEYVQMVEKQVMLLQMQLDYAKKALERAKTHPLFLNEDEIKRLGYCQVPLNDSSW